MAEIAVAEGEAAVEAQPAMAAVETAAVVTEDVKPAKGRGRRKAKAVEASPVETPAVEEAPTADVEIEAVAEIAEVMDNSADTAAPEASEDAAKPARANRESNVSSSAPVVKSTRANEGSESDGEPTKPKKAGWWQRRGFF